MSRHDWNRKVVAGAILSLFALPAIPLFVGSDSRAQAPPAAKPIPAPVVNAGALMRLFNKPLYTLLKEEMAQKAGSDKAWATIEERGLQAAEVANLIALRQAKPPQEQWVQFAGNLQHAGVTLAKAAKAKDWDATTKAYHGLIQRCNDCHQTRAPGKAPVLKP